VWSRLRPRLEEIIERHGALRERTSAPDSPMVGRRAWGSDLPTLAASVIGEVITPGGWSNRSPGPPWLTTGSAPTEATASAANGEMLVMVSPVGRLDRRERPRPGDRTWATVY
jgi:hypothetical protein